MSYEFPVCDVCGEQVTARVCGMRKPMTDKTAAALSAVLLAVHKRMAHEPPAEP